MATRSNPEIAECFIQLIALGRIKVYRSGRVENVRTGRSMVRRINSGYLAVFAMDPVSKKTRQILLHRLVWIAFRGRILDCTLQVNHKDGDKTNCRLRNLELLTGVENVQHSITVLKDTSRRKAKNTAENNPNSRFDNRTVLRLRKKFAVYGADYFELAQAAKVHPLTMFGLLRGDTYKSVKCAYTERCRELLPKVGKGNGQRLRSG